MPRIRHEPEDFRVEEIPIEMPCGEGHHTYVLVEKRLRTTEEAANQLAKAWGVPRRDVGYAGRKDRVAVTRQWLSLPGGDPDKARRLELPGLRVVDAGRHSSKLRLGQLTGNSFQLKVREVTRDLAKRASTTLGRLCRHGMPNRFGAQRFGRHGDNALRGAEILRSRRFEKNRRTAAFLVSALQSAVFNEVLERRRARLDQLVAGDVAMVHATGWLFLVERPEAEKERLDCFEVSPTGPIFGVKMKRPEGATAELERAVLSSFELDQIDALALPRGIRLHGGRRPLRVQPQNANCEWHEGVLELSFELPPGSYATVLLEELFPEGVEEGVDR